MGALFGTVMTVALLFRFGPQRKSAWTLAHSGGEQSRYRHTKGATIDVA